MYSFVPCSDAQSFPGQGHIFKSLKVTVSKEPSWSAPPLDTMNTGDALRVHQPTCADTRVPTYTDVSTQKRTPEDFPAFLYHW